MITRKIVWGENLDFTDFFALAVIHPGTNGKMIEVAAAMGLVNLDAIDNIFGVNHSNYKTYCNELSGLTGISLMGFNENEKNNYQYVVMEVGDECPVNRDQIVQALHAENILARKYFWPGCHNMKPYSELYPEAGRQLQNTQHVSERVIVLPTGTMMDNNKIRIVALVIRVLIEGKA